MRTSNNVLFVGYESKMGEYANKIVFRTVLL